LPAGFCTSFSFPLHLPLSAPTKSQICQFSYATGYILTNIAQTLTLYLAEDYSLLNREAVSFASHVPKFRINVLPPSSRQTKRFPLQSRRQQAAVPLKCLSLSTKPIRLDIPECSQPDNIKQCSCKHERLHKYSTTNFQCSAFPGYVSQHKLPRATTMHVHLHSQM